MSEDRVPPTGPPPGDTARLLSGHEERLRRMEERQARMERWIAELDGHVEALKLAQAGA